MKNLYLKFLVGISGFYTIIANAKTNDTSNILDKMSPGGNSIIQVETSSGGEEGLNVLDNLLNYIKDVIFGILPTLALFIFLLIGAKLFIARGNQEEFKKALMWFVYAAIGLAIIPLAWGVIYLLTTLTI